MTQEAPEGWNWGIGEVGSDYYDYWAYQENDEWELHMWWDRGNNHGVEVLPINGFDENGDPEYGYAERTCEFETQEEAEQYAQELMEEL